MIRLFVPLMSVALLAACGSPQPRLPPALEQAQMTDRDARRALRMGDMWNARTLFARSAELHQSVDDVDGTATALISLATLSHRMGDDAAAIAQLDRVLHEREGVYVPEWLVTAAFRKAVILLNLGRIDDAGPVLAAAGDRCGRDCALRPGIEVLKARLALLKGDAAAALELALPVASSRETGKEERANALRIAGASEEKLMRHDAALMHYRAALELDKPLGLSARIEADLNGMARALAGLGRAGEAEIHARRAALVREAARRDTATPSAPVRSRDE